jgi:sodium/hydrogen antiporter
VLTPTLLLFGAVLLALALLDRTIRRAPLAPAIVYLGVGWGAGALLGAPDAAAIESQVGWLLVAVELAVLVSLLAVGLRLRMPPALRLWRVAGVLAGPGMVATVVLGAAAALWLLDLPWPLALLLAAVLAPTDPVLASEVQIRDTTDRDAVRVSLTAEGGLNDATALPVVMLALGFMGLHALGPNALRWAWADLLWPIVGGALLGLLIGRLAGRALRWRLARGDTLARDELLFVGLLALAFGLARAAGTSTFIVVFMAGAALLVPGRAERPGSAEAVPHLGALSERLYAFGARVERLVEAATVLAVGFALQGVRPDALDWLFGLAMALVVRPLAVLLVVRPHGRGGVTRGQRRLVAWFGIRGVGSLFYAAFALEHGVAGGAAADLLAAMLAALAVSVLLHGVSATPLMAAYHRRVDARRAKVAPAAPPSAAP